MGKWLIVSAMLEFKEDKLGAEERKNCFEYTGGRLYYGFGMKSALTEGATEPWPKGVHPKEAEVKKAAQQPTIFR